MNAWIQSAYGKALCDAGKVVILVIHSGLFLSMSSVYPRGSVDYSVKHLFLFELVHCGEEFFQLRAKFLLRRLGSTGELEDG